MSEVRIIEKIKALLALSNSSNENEAFTALSKAQQLMMKYAIEESEIITSRDDGKLVAKDILRIEYGGWGKMPVEVPFFAPLIETFFAVKLYSTRTVKGTMLVFVGTKDNIANAIANFEFIQQAMLNCYRQKCIVASLKQSYFAGFRDGLKEQFIAQRDTELGQKYAIVLRDDKRAIELYLQNEEIKPRSKRGKSRNLYTEVYNAGKQDGKTVDVGGKTRKALV